jgi:hypothetical protein
MGCFKPNFIKVKFIVAEFLLKGLIPRNQVNFPIILPFCNKIVKSVLKL